MRDASVLPDAAVAVRDGRILDVGPRQQVERRYADFRTVDCRRGVLMPGLVDSHTHAIFGRPRADEQELRAAGLDYMEIARRGGGIHASVRDLRSRSAEELVSLAVPRLRRLASHGTTTVEVKSGYGLTLEDELKTLHVIARVASIVQLRLVPTFLGAHEIPLEARATADGRSNYIDLLVHEMIPRVAQQELALLADVFCEPGAYTVPESRQILAAARDAGLGLKLHADELRSSGGASGPVLIWIWRTPCSPVMSSSTATSFSAMASERLRIVVDGAPSTRISEPALCRRRSGCTSVILVGLAALPLMWIVSISTSSSASLSP
jgi:imidazolonepropionase